MGVEGLIQGDEPTQQRCDSVEQVVDVGVKLLKGLHDFGVVAREAFEEIKLKAA